MKRCHLFVILFLSHIGWSHAEIYKRIDANGHVTYSSEPIKGSKKLILKPLPTLSGRGSQGSGTPEDFPKVDSQTQKSRDATRRVILQDELASEEGLLATARENLRNVENNPEPLIGPDGVPFRNAAKQAEKLKAAQDMVTLHEQNISALRTELSKFKQ